jgi:hypothetical protein
MWPSYLPPFPQLPQPCAAANSETTTAPDTAVSVAVDIDDEGGANTLQSGYIRVS